MSAQTTNKYDELLYDTLKDSVEFAKQGGEWLAGQIPDIVEQLLTWYTVQYTLLIVVGLLVVTFSYKLGKKWCKKSDGLSVVGGIISGLVGGILTINSIFNLAFILTAPKVWLLQYTANLLSGK